MNFELAAGAVDRLILDSMGFTVGIDFVLHFRSDYFERQRNCLIGRD